MSADEIRIAEMPPSSHRPDYAIALGKRPVRIIIDDTGVAIARPRSGDPVVSWQEALARDPVLRQAAAGIVAMDETLVAIIDEFWDRLEKSVPCEVAREVLQIRKILADHPLGPYGYSEFGDAAYQAETLAAIREHGGALIAIPPAAEQAAGMRAGMALNAPRGASDYLEVLQCVVLCGATWLIKQVADGDDRPELRRLVVLLGRWQRELTEQFGTDRRIYDGDGKGTP